VARKNLPGLTKLVTAFSEAASDLNNSEKLQQAIVSYNSYPTEGEEAAQWDKPQHPLYSAEVTREKLINDVRKDMSGKKNRFPQLYWIITLALLIGIWPISCRTYPICVADALAVVHIQGAASSVADPKILIALLITLKRVGIGFRGGLSYWNLARLSDGLFQNDFAFFLTFNQLGAPDSHYGLGTAHDSLVWIGRPRPTNLPDCFCRNILYHAEYDFRRARYLSRLL